MGGDFPSQQNFDILLGDERAHFEEFFHEKMVVIGFVISVLRIQKVEEKNKPELLFKKLQNENSILERAYSLRSFLFS